MAIAWLVRGDRPAPELLRGRWDPRPPKGWWGSGIIASFARPGPATAWPQSRPFPARAHARAQRTRGGWDPHARKGWRGSVVLHEAAPARPDRLPVRVEPSGSVRVLGRLRGYLLISGRDPRASKGGGGPSYYMKPPRLDVTACPSRLSFPGACACVDPAGPPTPRWDPLAPEGVPGGPAYIAVRRGRGRLAVEAEPSGSVRVRGRTHMRLGLRRRAEGVGGSARIR